MRGTGWENAVNPASISQSVVPRLSRELFEGDRKLAVGSTTRRASRPSRTSSKNGRRVAVPAPQEGRAVAIRRGPQVPADQLLQIADIGHERAGDLILRQHCARAAESRLVTVDRPGGSSGAPASSGSWSSGTSGHVEDRQDLLASIQESRAVEVAQGFQVTAILGWRLAMATSRSSRKTWRIGRFCRRASSSRHSASRRAISRLRRPSWCRPGNRRQRSSVGRSGDRSSRRQTRRWPSRSDRAERGGR